MTTESVGEEFGTCANCGAPLRLDVEYPVTTATGENGEFRLYSFCDEDCQIGWEEDE